METRTRYGAVQREELPSITHGYARPIYSVTKFVNLTRRADYLLAKCDVAFKFTREGTRSAGQEEALINRVNANISSLCKYPTREREREIT